MSPELELTIATVLGLCSHWAVFVHGELDLAAATFARFYLALGTILVIAKCHFELLPLKTSLREIWLLSVVYSAALFVSVVIYRLFFHPLRHIPGPLRLKVTKLTHLVDMALSQNYNVLHCLHEQYGDVVRSGPNEVTLFGTEAFYLLHGPDSRCRRAQYYDLLHPMISLDTARDPVVHAQRRKIWEQAFSIKALKQHESIVYDQANILVRQLEAREGKVIDISTWLEYYSFDLMGKFGLTIDFDTLPTGKPHPILTLYNIAHSRLGPLAAAPWLKHLMMGIPGIESMKYYRQFMDWAADELDRNIKTVHEDRTDIIGFVIRDAQQKGGVQANWNFVLGDFVLVMAAGSEPMRQVLTHLIYYLILNPRHVSLIRHQLDQIDLSDYADLQHMTHLNACIYETLRLNPAVPTAGLRMAPKGGLNIAGVYIPENTTVVAPQYSLFRDGRNFLQPTKWIPERFTTMPQLILDKTAYQPWSIGKMSCLGKNLSLVEIRVAAALMISRFNFAFGPSETGQRMFDDALDFFTVTPGQLNIIVTARDKSSV